MKIKISHIFSFLLLALISFGATNLKAQESDLLNPDEILSNIEAPKIIKNNVRITDLQITKKEINNGQIYVEGNFNIVNNSDSETSNLYTTQFLGLKGSTYFLEYPRYTNSKSEPFKLKPRETINRSFSLNDVDISNFGHIALEVWIIDEYNRKNNIEISEVLFLDKQISGEIFTDLSINWVIDEKTFPPNSGPTFYPEKEEKFLTISDFDSQQISIEKIEIDFYDRNFFTEPVKTIKEDVFLNTDKEIVIELPKDLNPGVYPVRLRLISDSGSYIPYIYGRFIVGGNMIKVTDVLIDDNNKKVKNIMLVVQGNPQDIVEPSRDEQAFFDARVVVLDKNNNELFSAQAINQDVLIYRNIDLDVPKGIKKHKIFKIKVELSNEDGIFHVYEKEFDFKKDYSKTILTITLFLLLAIVIFVLKKKSIIFIIVFLTIFSISKVTEISYSAGMTPEPYDQLGMLVYRDGPSTWNGLLRHDDLLSAYGISVNFHKPNFDTCYSPGQLIPFVVEINYQLCDNTPLTLNQSDSCTPQNPCSPSAASIYFDSYLNIGTNSVFDPIRTWVAEAIDGDAYNYDLGDSHNRTYRYLTVSSNDWKIFKLQDLAKWVDASVPRRNFALEEKFLRPTIDHVDYVNVPVSGWTGNGMREYTMLAPEKPGNYPVFFTAKFATKQGDAYYIAEHNLKVCGKHDVDFIMPGTQTINDDGYFVDSSGTVVPGYIIQRYPMLINNPEFLFLDNTNEPGVNFNMLTFANYCGLNDNWNLSTVSRPTSVFTNPLNKFGNTWTNIYNNFNLETHRDNRIQKRDELRYFLNNQYGVMSLNTPVSFFGYVLNEDKYLASKKTLQPMKNLWPYTVHNINGLHSFIQLASSSAFPETITRPDQYNVFNKAFGQTELNMLPRKSLQNLFNEGFLNVGYITNTNPLFDADDIYLIKETVKSANQAVTYSHCSIYADFCPGQPGLQYLIESANGVNLELWNVTDQNEHNLVATRPRNSTREIADQMCNEVFPPEQNIITSCTVVSPNDSDQRTVGTEITFQASVSGDIEGANITYAWNGASPVSAGSNQARRTYNTEGSKTDVSVRININDNPVDVSCPVNILPTPTNLSCSADPEIYVLNDGQSTQTVTFSASSNKAITQYSWTDSNDNTGTNSSFTNNYSVENPNQNYAHVANLQAYIDGVWEDAQCSTQIFPYGYVFPPPDPLPGTGPEPKPIKITPPTITPGEMCGIEMLLPDIENCVVKGGGLSEPLLFTLTNGKYSCEVGPVQKTTIYTVECTDGEGAINLSTSAVCQVNPRFIQF
jgi:hypothetical protein